VRNSYKYFHENSTDSLAIDTRLEREREGGRKDRKKEMKRSSYFSFLICNSLIKTLKMHYIVFQKETVVAMSRCNNFSVS